MSLVTTDWLFENINNVKIIDSSWHLPSQNRNGQKEYFNEHIKNSIFFDIDKYSNQDEECDSACQGNCTDLVEVSDRMNICL